MTTRVVGELVYSRSTWNGFGCPMLTMYGSGGHYTDHWFPSANTGLLLAEGEIKVAFGGAALEFYVGFSNGYAYIAGVWHVPAVGQYSLRAGVTGEMMSIPLHSPPALLMCRYPGSANTDWRSFPATFSQGH